MTGRGFRDESCSRGLSTVTVGNVRLVASSFKKNTLSAFSPVLTQAPPNQQSFRVNPRCDVTNNIFLSLTVEPSIFFIIAFVKDDH